MRNACALLVSWALLSAADLSATSAGAILFERTDATGTSVTVVEVEKVNGKWQTTKIGSMPPAVAPTSFAFAPDASFKKGYVFRSRGGAVPETSVFSVDNGAIPRHERTSYGSSYAALAPFSDVEVLGWEEEYQSVWIVGVTAELVVTPVHFLGVPLQDVSLARIASDRILVLGYKGTRPPPPGLPIEYTLFDVQLEPGGQATVLSQSPAPKKIPGAATVFSSAGAYYVASDAPQQFRVRHAPVPRAMDNNRYLVPVTVNDWQRLVPIAQVSNGSALASTSLLLQAGDAFIEVPFGTRWPHVVVDAHLFSATALGLTTRRNGSRGTPAHRALGVTPPKEAFHTKRYLAAVGGGNAGPAAPTQLTLVTTHLENLWQDVFGAAVPPTIAAADLVVLLERHSMKSDWLDRLLKKVDAGVVKNQLHLEKRGYPWGEVGQGGTVPSATLLQLLAAIPGCAALLTP